MGNTDIFEMIANSYDTPERIHITKLFSDTIREYLVDAKNKNAIDFGCGTGLVGMNLLNDFQSILFLDTSQNMIHQVKQKIARSNIRNADSLCFDFEKDSLTDLHTDYLLMVQVLLHIQDFQSVLKKLYDVLNPGGHLIIIDFNQNDKIVSDLVHSGFDQAMLTEVMSQIGYKGIRSQTFYKGSQIFMGQDASLFILDAQKLAY